MTRRFPYRTVGRAVGYTTMWASPPLYRALCWTCAFATVGFGIYGWTIKGYQEVFWYSLTGSLFFVFAALVNRRIAPLSSGLRRIKRMEREAEQAARQARREYEQPGEWHH